MKRRHLIGVALAGAALFALPATAVAQLPPSPPVALYYGTAAGATTGQAVLALVANGSSWTGCGSSTIQDVSGPVYAVDVVSDSQLAGCGQSGRTVRIYLPPVNGNPGKLSTNSDTIPSSFQARNLNATFGTTLYVAGRLPIVASDKVN